MNKTQLIDAVAANTSGLTKKAIGEVIDSTFDAIGNALKAKDQVQLIGFGTFLTGERAAREGRNPRTGETLKIKASVTPKFRPGKGLKDKVA